MTVIQTAMEKGLIFDGAMGTMLIDAGLDGGMPSEAWVLERPEQISAVHQAYVGAGAEVITTCTFGASGIKLAKAGLSARADDINRQAARLARSAAGGDRFVAGNMGPLGQLLQPHGELSRSAAVDSFTQQASVLAQNGVDLFLAQTFFDLEESLAAIEGIRQVSAKPILATLTFQEIPKGFATLMGNRVADSMRAILDAGAAAAGANCSLGSDRMLGLAAEIRLRISAPVVIQPNAGAPLIQAGKTVYTETMESYVENLCRIRELGVEIVGGCCGSTPEHIHRLVQKTRTGGCAMQIDGM